MGVIVYIVGDVVDHGGQMTQPTYSRASDPLTSGIFCCDIKLLQAAYHTALAIEYTEQKP